jgi:hypothetical protein
MAFALLAIAIINKPPPDHKQTIFPESLNTTMLEFLRPLYQINCNTIFLTIRSELSGMNKYGKVNTGWKKNERKKYSMSYFYAEKIQTVGISLNPDSIQVLLNPDLDKLL